MSTTSTMTFTTNHASSSYGQHVLVDSGNNAYGIGDTFPNGESVKSYLQRAENGELEVGECYPSFDDIDAFDLNAHSAAIREWAKI
jgi:hypothetical protein